MSSVPSVLLNESAWAIRRTGKQSVSAGTTTGPVSMGATSALSFLFRSSAKLSKIEG